MGLTSDNRMDGMMIFVIIVAMSFVLLFITKRKFGLPSLALAAGSILSSFWAERASYVLGMLNAPSSIYVVTFISVIIIILPAFLMIFHDGKCKSLYGRAIGAGLFALLIAAFLIEPIGRVVVFDGLGGSVYGWLIANKGVITTACLSLAVIDLLLPKHHHNLDNHHSSH